MQAKEGLLSEGLVALAKGKEETCFHYEAEIYYIIFLLYDEDCCVFEPILIFKYFLGFCKCILVNR